MRSMVRPGTSGSHVICKSLSKGAPEIQIQHYQLSSTPNKSQRRSFFRLFDKESLPNSDYHRFDRHPECLTSVKTRRKRYHSSVPNYANVEQSSYILEAKRRWETKRWRKYNRDGTALISSVDTTGSKPLEAYVKHFEPLLDAELLKERKLWLDELSQLGLETLITDGYTLTDLRSDPYVPRKASEGLSSEDENLTLNFFPNPKRSMLVDRFSLGAQVTIVPINRSPLDFVDQVRGTVIYASTAQIRVEMASLDPREVWPHQPQLWRLDLDFNETNFSRCRTAIMQLQYNPTTMENYSDNSWEYPLEGTHLRHALLRQWSCVAHQGTGEVRPDIGRSIAFSSKNDTSRPSIFAYHPGLLDWARRYSSAGPIKRRGDPVLRLNRVQVRAIALMLLKRVSLIQGPPGTGKTRTITEAIRLLKAHFKVPHPILICAHTNIAVDNIVMGIAATGMRPLRVGSGGSVEGGLLEWSLATQIEMHPDAYKLAKLKECRKDETERRDRFLNRDPVDWLRAEELLQSIQTLRTNIWRLERDICRDIFDQADAICTTSLTAGSSLFEIKDFPIVFQDEASMSTEPVSLIPLMRGCEHLCLIGDHKQLPPVIVSEAAQAGGLSTSLFERLMRGSDTPRIMLNTQYRMHPGISAFPRKEFYNSTLQDSNDDPTGITEAPLISSYFRECKARSKDKSLSTIFIHHDHGESRSSQSRTNHGDMSIVVSVVEDLLRRNPDMLGKDIGVIAPYSAQIRHLSRILKDNQEWKAYFLEHLGKKRASEIQNIDIQTVDGFQGREKKAIIFSTVRNNRFGYIGFLADRRRMNVALTRAKSGLFVIGNMATLSKHVYSPNLDIETIEDQKGEERVYRKGVEWRNYVRDVVARGLFIEYYHPVKYVSGTANR